MKLTNYLETCASSFIGASIERCKVSGKTEFSYRINAQDIRNGGGVQRITSPFAKRVVGFFASLNMKAEYQERWKSFKITFDLNKCVLSAEQAAEYQERVMEYRRKK